MLLYMLLCKTNLKAEPGILTDLQFILDFFQQLFLLFELGLQPLLGLGQRVHILSSIILALH